MGAGSKTAGGEGVMAGETATAMAFAERIEWLAIMAARASAHEDKSEYIRFWAAARVFRGLPHDADNWDAAVDRKGSGS
jgi:hypothetical protein